MKDPKAIRKAIMTARSIAAMVDPNFARVPLPQVGEPDTEEMQPPLNFMGGGYASGGEVYGDNSKIKVVGNYEGEHRLVPISPKNTNYQHVMEYVPIDWLMEHRGNEYRHSPERMEQLRNEIQEEGLREPVLISTGKNSRTSIVGEGNHRVLAAKQLGYTHIPVRAMVGSSAGNDRFPEGAHDEDIIPEPNRYFPSDAKPSRVMRSLGYEGQPELPEDWWEKGYAAGGEVEQTPDYSTPDDMGLYSQAAVTAGGLQRTDTPDSYKEMLMKRGVKQSEFGASGYDQAFADQPQITREQVAKHFHENRFPIEEKGFYENPPQGEGAAESSGRPYHEHHMLPGGENYREIMLKHGGDEIKFPGDPSHLGGEPNVLVHLLMKDRTDSEDKRIAHLDEMQADWAQKGRKQGFDKGSESGQKAISEFEDYSKDLRQRALEAVLQRAKDLGQDEQDIGVATDLIKSEQSPEMLAYYAGGQDEADRLTEMRVKAEKAQNAISPAPYVTKTDDWVSLGLKRALLEAAKGGYDKLAWTPGDVVAERYNLSKHIKDIHHEKNDDGTYNITAYNHKGAKVYDEEDLPEKNVVDALGEGIAGKIFSGEGTDMKEAQARIDSAHKAYEAFKDKLIATGVQHTLDERREEDPNFNFDEDQKDNLKNILRETVNGGGIHTYAHRMGLHDEHQPLYNELRNAHSDMNKAPYSPYRDWRTLSGLDLKVGGEGLKWHQDKIIPKELMKLAKKHDPDAQFSVSTVRHPHPDYDNDDEEERPEVETDLHALEITPKMRESILKHGFAAHADGGRVEGYADGGDVDPERVREYMKRIQSPLSDNPESVKRALQIAQSYRGKTGMETGTGSFYNIKQSMPVSDVRSTIGDIPGISLKKENPLSWEKFHDIAKGGSLINMGGDLSNFGRLTHINDKELAWPVDLHAGAKYMREPNPGQVWRNNKSHATGFLNKIKSEEAAGRDVYGILSPMGPTAVNSSHNMFDALMAQIPTAKIKKADLEAFDQAILNGEHLPADVRKNPTKLKRALEALEQWPGIANAKAASEYARPQSGNLNGGHRSLIVDFMDKSKWRDKGFPEVGVTRAAITDPALKGISGNLLGHRVVKLSSKASEEPELFEHSTYEKPSFGEYVGDVPLAQRHYVMPDVVEKMIASPTQKGQVVHPYSEDAMGRSTARKLFEEQKQVQPINQRMLDSVMMDEENRQKYGLKRGGAARSALMIAKGMKKR